MPNPLFERLSQGIGGRTDTNTSDRAETVRNGVSAPQDTFMDAMRQLRENPGEMVRNAGFQIPDGIAGNPQATVMHLIRTGQVGGPMMQRIAPMISRMTGGR